MLACTKIRFIHSYYKPSSSTKIIIQQQQQTRRYRRTAAAILPLLPPIYNEPIANNNTNGSFPNISSLSSSSSSPSSPSSSPFVVPSHHARGGIGSAELHYLIGAYARQPQHGVTLLKLLSRGENPTPLSLIESAQYLYQQLPIRLAKKVNELQSLPYGLSQTPAVNKVKGWYEESFQDILIQSEPRTSQQELIFTNTLERIYQRHSGVIPTMAQGVLQMKHNLGPNRVFEECPFLLDFLNRFYASRMGIRLLISQHVALHHPRPGWIGTVALHASPVQIIRTAVNDAAKLCERHYLTVPDVIVTGDELATLAFLPSHLHHIVFELVKNAMRATVERHSRTLHDHQLPPIHIVVSHDDKEFSVKISDQGGGIPRSDLPRIWSYLYTTINHDTDSLLTALEDASNDTQSMPMAGFGYGLPISRLYARFFGGDLELLTMPNYGTDCFLYLRKLGDVELFVD